MKSARGIRNLRQAIEFWQPKFRLLDKLLIKLDADTRKGGHIHHGPAELAIATATLERGPCRVDVNRYVYHELLHLAIVVAGTEHHK